MRAAMLIVWLGLMGACAPVPSAVRAVPAPPLATFEFQYRDGYLYAVLDGRAVQFATDMTLATQSSGSSGTTTPSANTILLHQTLPVSAATRDLACNAPPFGDAGIPVPFQGFCTTIEMINGFAQTVINPYAQVIALSPCGTTTSVVTYVKSESNAEIGVNNSLGLWSYGSHLNAAGSAGDRAQRNWYFATDVPGAVACVRFTVTAMGEPI